MLTRSIASAAAALALAGCYRQASPPAPAAGAAAGATGDEADPGWPTSLEFEITEKSGVLKHGGLAMISVDASLPVFRSEPPAIAAALNARLARFAKPDLDPRTDEGSYTVDCTVELANRYAVIINCSLLVDLRTHEEAAQATGGSPAGPRPVVLGWWLRRGLPELSIEQFSPRFDLRATIDAAAASAPAGCDLRACAFDPKSFTFDSGGITLVPTEYCVPDCDGSEPSIPLDELAPAHAWAVELVKRVRRRVDAGDLLVEGNRTY